MVSSYLSALQEEIEKYYHQEVLETIYLGGGTPSSLSLKELERLFQIVSVLKRTSTCEYTIECNVEHITEEQLQLMVRYGVNRISIGIQTLQPNYLSFLNRKHTKEEVFAKIQLVKKYFQNINVDLMYAFPGQTMEELEQDLEDFLSLNVPHISTYSLIIEEHTMLYNQKIEPIAEDLDADMYERIVEKLQNYHHYEISNFAKVGYESKHNLTYWNNEEYYGFGLGASGYQGTIRYDNTRSLSHYRKGKYRYQEENVSLKEQLENEFILGLRKIDGVSVDKIKRNYQMNPLDWQFIQKLLEEKKLEYQNGFLKLAQNYWYLSNEILVLFLDNEEWGVEE